MSVFDAIEPGECALPAAGRIRLPPPPLPVGSPFGPYHLDPALAEAVNLAIGLGRPLFVTGESGTGKTALAWGIATQLGCRVLEYRVKSTSQARDLLYTVDTLRRLDDASRPGATLDRTEAYLEFQALGEAIRSTETHVVLIDGVDLGPRDFACDLLNELELMSFRVPELGPDTEFAAKARHVVLLTGQGERELPDAFVRRCVCHHLEIPDRAGLARIVELHTRRQRLPDALVAAALDRFLALRDLDLYRRPSVAELLDWVRALGSRRSDAEQVRAAPAAGLPGLGLLVKHPEDRRRLREGA